MTRTLYDPVLAILTAQVDDFETLRIANQHRYRLFISEEVGKDGVTRGLNIPDTDPNSVRLKRTLDELDVVEQHAIKHLEQHMRNSVWHPWQQQAVGVGHKQLARLLGEIGDPYWHRVEDRPRTVSELWAFAGEHTVPSKIQAQDDSASSEVRYIDGPNVAPRRQRGQKSNWSENARKRIWLIATSIVKTKGPYRDVYDRAREKYAHSLHPVPCIRCGPSGKPAKEGTPLSPGHQHARALRIVAKTVLRDLWVEARRLHEELGMPV